MNKRQNEVEKLHKLRRKWHTEENGRSLMAYFVDNGVRTADGFEVDLEYVQIAKKVEWNKAIKAVDYSKDVKKT